MSIGASIAIVVFMGIVSSKLGSFLDFDGDIFSPPSSEKLRIKNMIFGFELSVLDKLGDVLGFGKDGVVGSAEFYFPDDDPEVADLGRIYFAEKIGDFDDVERFDALGGGRVLSGDDIGLEDGVGAHQDTI